MEPTQILSHSGGAPVCGVATLFTWRRRGGVPWLTEIDPTVHRTYHVHRQGVLVQVLTSQIQCSRKMERSLEPLLEKEFLGLEAEGLLEQLLGS